MIIHSHPRAVRKAPRGFTLVELLVVIGILVILITMLTPTVNAVRTMGKVTATKVLLHTLDTGLNMFKGEIRLGRDYPPSWLTGIALPGIVGKVDLYGAQTLAYALAGPNLTGTPGLRPGLLNTSPTYGPFVDVGKAKLTRPSQFTPSLSWPTCDFFVFEDSFGKPVLYFRADSGASVPVEIYDWTHNLDILCSPARIGNIKPFVEYIRDLRVSTVGSANFTPQNNDSYLLISAGPDLVYGTADDVTNFTPNPQ